MKREEQWPHGLSQWPRCAPRGMGQLSLSPAMAFVFVLVCVLCRAPRRVLARDRHLCRRSDSAAEGECKLTRLETDSSRQAPLRISPGALARVWDAQFLSTSHSRLGCRRRDSHAIDHRRVTMIYVMSSLARRPMCVALITDLKDRTRSDLDALKDRTRSSVRRRRWANRRTYKRGRSPAGPGPGRRRSPVSRIEGTRPVSRIDRTPPHRP